MDASKLTIVECTVDQARQTRRNTFTTWGEPGGFDEAWWIHRFETLEKDVWAEGDRYKCWTLVPRDDTTTLDMLAHCETFRRPSLSCQPGSTQLNHVFSYGIAGVFTPQDKRGHGYARQLLRLLHYVMAPTSKLPPFPATWGPPPSIKGFGDASFSVLYSGVGDKYYASCKRGDGETSLLGWERQHVTSRHWTVPQEPMEGEADVQGDWIGSDGLQALENIATETMTRELGKSSSEEYRVAILPNEALFRIHTLRFDLSPARKSSGPRTYGLVLEDSSSGSRPFIVYFFPESNKASPKLEVLYVQHPFPFEAVVAAARKAGCGSIKMWGDRGGWDEYHPRLEKDSEMPCMVSYDYPTDKTHWQWLENYTWC